MGHNRKNDTRNVASAERRLQPLLSVVQRVARSMGARNPSQRSFGLVDQLPHDVGYGQDLFDGSSGLSRPNQRFSTLSAAESFDKFRPKAFPVPAGLIPFTAPFIQKRSAQGSPDGAVSDRAQPLE